MPIAKVLRIYLDDIPRARAESGNCNFVNKIRGAFEKQGFRVELRRNTAAESMKSARRRGYSLFLMDEPFHSRALTFRKAYFYPFWRIETSAKRWEWEIAKSTFEPNEIDLEAADRFCRYWRRTHFPKAVAARKADNSVYMPLQGRLLEQRSFQDASPLEMIRAVLLHDQNRQVVIGLHPRETYLSEEIDALNELIDSEPRLRLSAEPMQTLLQRCDYVVTENSSVALLGFFLHVPAVLFAKIDFHHIAANVEMLGAEGAIKSAPALSPDYNRYLYWFFKLTAIHGGAPDVEERILETVRHHGWEV